MVRASALIGALVLAGCSGTPPCEDDIGAFVISQQFIKQRLRSPSTAEFPSFSDPSVSVLRTNEGGRCAFIVSTPVDAQNAFGATIRENFIVKVVPPMTGDQWRLEAIATP